MANGDCAGVCGHASPNSVACKTADRGSGLWGSRKRFAPSVDWPYGTPSHCFISVPLPSLTSTPVITPSDVVSSVGSVETEDESFESLLQAGREITKIDTIRRRKALGIRAIQTHIGVSTSFIFVLVVLTESLNSLF